MLYQKPFLLALLFVLLIANASKAQLSSIDHLEINIKNQQGSDFTNHQTISLGREGMIVSMTHYVKMKKEYVLVKYDTAFRPLWQQTYTTKPDNQLSNYYIADNDIYFLVSQQRYEYEIIKISLLSGDMQIIPYKKVVKAEYNNIRVVKNVILLGGEADNNPIVMHLDTKTGKQHLLPSLVHKSTYLAALETDEELGVILATVAGKYNSYKYSFFYIYDLEGNLKENITIPDSKEYNLLTFRPLIKSTQEMLVIGTYASRKSKRPQGIYSLILNTQIKSKPKFKFYDFSYFNNFFNSLDEDDREKMLQKVKKLRGKGDYKRYGHEYFVNSLRLDQDKIYLSLEGYVPVYQRQDIGLGTLNNMGMMGLPGMNNNLFLNRNNRFTSARNGATTLTYKYKQAIVCSFDWNGNMLWDNHMDFDDIELFEPIPFFDYSVSNDTVAMLRLEDEELFYKQMYRSNEQGYTASEELPLKDSLDNVGNHNDEVLLHWYDDIYILTGYRTIRNPQATPFRRRVFYFTKLNYKFSEEEVNKEDPKEDEGS